MYVRMYIHTYVQKQQIIAKSLISKKLKAHT